MIEEADVRDCKTIRFAKLNFTGRRCYPGLSGAEWYAVLDRECISDGVILKVRGGPVRLETPPGFRDLPPPS